MLPKKVREKVGFALYIAQQGQQHEAVKPLTGFGGRVLEVVEDYNRGTYRAVYTVRFIEAIYVLHVFQKKAKRGIATSNRDINLITVRLREAARMHARQQGAKR